MQEPLDNLSANARLVHQDLADHPDTTRKPDAIAKNLGGQLTAGEVADALRELETAKRAAQTFGGWPILT